MESADAEDWELIEYVVDGPTRRHLIVAKKDDTSLPVTESDHVRSIIHKYARNRRTVLNAPQTSHTERSFDYHYEALQPGDTIRLLRLYANENTEEIHCGLFAYSLKDEHLPNYRAVSYTWLENTPLRQIRCGHSRLLVRENLFVLLGFMRHRKFDCWLWIDAICINQASNTEKSHQVKLMGSIYTQANSVIAWLGPDDEACRHAFNVVHRLSRTNETPTSCGDLWPWQRECDSMVEFLRLRYWTRKWIIQEVVLARSVVLCAGASTLAMDNLEHLFDSSGDVRCPYSRDDRTQYKYWFSNVVPEAKKSPVSTLTQHRAALRESSNNMIDRTMGKNEHSAP